MALKDLLLKAGVVSAEDVARIDQETPAARPRDTSLRGITQHWQGRIAAAADFEGQMAAANGWIGEIRKSEFRRRFTDAFGEPDLIVLRIAEPYDEALVARVEKQLGWTLPADYRHFLLSVGTVGIRTYAWDAMLPLDKLLGETASLRAALPDLPKQAVAFASEADSNTFALVEANDEVSVLHWIHDDASEQWPGSFTEWFARRLDYTLEIFTDRM